MHMLFPKRKWPNLVNWNLHVMLKNVNTEIYEKKNQIVDLRTTGIFLTWISTEAEKPSYQKMTRPPSLRYNAERVPCG